MSELSVRWSIDGDFWDIIKISKVAFMAMIRSFFVLGFYNMIRLNQSVQHEEAQRQQTERILLLVSDLYEESVQLGKTLSHAEQITRESYELYRELQQDESLKDREHYARQALRISGQVHEIKKDSQRIFAGLSKLIDAESGVHYMASQELGELIIRTNSKYAQSLDKSIRFTLDVDPLLPKLHVYTVLTLINNLTANAVEAMRDDGRIDVSIRCLPGKEDIASFSVTDNGPGIPQRNGKWSSHQGIRPSMMRKDNRRPVWDCFMYVRSRRALKERLNYNRLRKRIQIDYRPLLELHCLYGN